jgi:hypothetical protein
LEVLINDFGELDGDVSSRLKSLRTDFVHPCHRKNFFHEFAALKFYVGEWCLELIICLLDGLKNDFFEVDEVMIQDFKRPWELIFCYLGIENSELVEIA